MSAKPIRVMDDAELSKWAEAVERGDYIPRHVVRSFVHTARVLGHQRRELAKLARPDHPNGGFFNPIAGWEAQSLADNILAADTAPHLSPEDRES